MRVERPFCVLCVLCVLLLRPPDASTHPLGNFTVNHYSRLEVSGPAADRPDGMVRIRYIVDMAEIPTFQELQAMDTDENGVTSEAERDLYLTVKANEIRQGLRLWIEQRPVELTLRSRDIQFPAGQGGLLTLRMSLILDASIPPGPSGSAPAVRRVEYRDEHDPDRIGWREIVVRAMPGAAIRTSTVSDRDRSDELRHYPQDMLSSPLNERTAQFTMALGGESGVLSGIGSLGQRAVARSKDTFAELISARELSSTVIMWSLLVACGLGALHALSPGHGKTIVGAYLVGARGTARHALFLGLTVTATHTSGVFALGLITLYASQFILPERLYPWLSVASGLIVVILGVSLCVSRLRNLFSQDHDHHHHTHDDHEHTHGHGHSHIPIGPDGRPVTWRSLLALGVSGGMLPCPSALVVLLGAIALHRVGFGLLLIVAFSLGLAGVLTGIGLLMVRARRLFDGIRTNHPIVSALPVVSAGVITIAGLFIIAQGLVQAGALHPQAVLDGLTRTAIGSTLGLGFVLGLKHALDADHLVAVTTIVSERRGMLGSSLIGVLWGLGHTVSLLAVGLVVVALNLQIPERFALMMEFAVAVMLVVLGADLIRKLIRGAKLHIHPHEHGERWHIHPHLHEQTGQVSTHSHHPIRTGKRPFFIGMVHGLAGSATLMLLVLVTIPSRILGLIYIGVFGIGSVGGMLVMSTLVSLPFVMTVQRFRRLNVMVRALAGVFSVGFGLFLAWQIGFVQGLLL